MKHLLAFFIISAATCAGLVAESKPAEEGGGFMIMSRSWIRGAGSAGRAPILELRQREQLPGFATGV